jgi:hypothetical protein
MPSVPLPRLVFPPTQSLISPAPSALTTRPIMSRGSSPCSTFAHKVPRLIQYLSSGKRWPILGKGALRVSELHGQRLHYPNLLTHCILFSSSASDDCILKIRAISMLETDMSSRSSSVRVRNAVPYFASRTQFTQVSKTRVRGNNVPKEQYTEKKLPDL